VEVLKLLAAQAAISIDNATLYQQLEQALKQANESSRVKSDLLARTFHELRTPLRCFPETADHAALGVLAGVVSLAGADERSALSVGHSTAGIFEENSK